MDIGCIGLRMVAEPGGIGPVAAKVPSVPGGMLKLICESGCCSKKRTLKLGRRYVCAARTAACDLLNSSRAIRTCRLFWIAVCTASSRVSSWDQPAGTSANRAQTCRMRQAPRFAARFSEAAAFRLSLCIRTKLTQAIASVKRKHRLTPTLAPAGHDDSRLVASSRTHAEYHRAEKLPVKSRNFSSCADICFVRLDIRV